MKIYEAKLQFTLLRELEHTPARPGPERTLAYMRGAFDDYPDQEQLWVVFLNRKSRGAGRTGSVR